MKLIQFWVESWYYMSRLTQWAQRTDIFKKMYIGWKWLKIGHSKTVTHLHTLHSYILTDITAIYIRSMIPSILKLWDSFQAKNLVKMAKNGQIGLRDCAITPEQKKCRKSNFVHLTTNIRGPLYKKISQFWDDAFWENWIFVKKMVKKWSKWQISDFFRKSIFFSIKFPLLTCYYNFYMY